MFLNNYLILDFSDRICSWYIKNLIIKIQIELEIFKISGINDRRIVDGFLFLEKISNKRAFLKINSNLSAQLYVNVNKKMYQQIFCFFEFYLKTFYKKFISYFWKPRYLKKKIIFKIMPVYILNIDNNSFRKKDCLQLCYRWISNSIYMGACYFL